MSERSKLARAAMTLCRRQAIDIGGTKCRDIVGLSPKLSSQFRPRGVHDRGVAQQLLRVGFECMRDPVPVEPKVQADVENRRCIPQARQTIHGYGTGLSVHAAAVERMAGGARLPVVMRELGVMKQPFPQLGLLGFVRRYEGNRRQRFLSCVPRCPNGRGRQRRASPCSSERDDQGENADQSETPRRQRSWGRSPRRADESPIPALLSCHQVDLSPRL